MKLSLETVRKLLAAIVVVPLLWLTLFEIGLSALQLAGALTLLAALAAFIACGRPSARFVGLCVLAAFVIAPTLAWLLNNEWRHGPQLLALLVVGVGLAGVAATRRARDGEYDPLALLSAVLLLAGLVASRARIEEFGPEYRGVWLDHEGLSLESRAPLAWDGLRLALALYVSSFVVGALGLARLAWAGRRSRGVYLCLYGLLIAPVQAGITLTGIGGPNVGPVDHERFVPLLLAGPALALFALASGAMLYLAGGLVVRALRPRAPQVARAAWPLAFVAWVALVALQVPKVIGADFGWRSQAPELPVASTGASGLELDPWGSCIWLRDEHTALVGHGLDLRDPAEWARGELRRLLSSARGDELWWASASGSRGPARFTLGAAPDAPFTWLAAELRWFQEELGTVEANLAVRLPEVEWSWRVWMAGFPASWSSPAYLPIRLAARGERATIDAALDDLDALRLELDGHAGPVRVAPGPGLTYAQLVSAIDQLRERGSGEVELVLD